MSVPAKNEPPPCVYCGEQIPLGQRNQEHCVGRQFFPSPRPSDLDKLVVPSCRACNEKWKHDEDYFRAMATLTDAGLSDVGKKNVAHVHNRSLRKDGGLRAAVARGIARVQPQTPMGLVLRPVLAQTIAWDRVDRVLAKWVRGLYWKEYKARLDTASSFKTAMTSIDALGKDHHGTEPLVGAGSWPGTFQYWHTREEREPMRSRWSFLLWDRLALVVATNQAMEVHEVDLFGGFGDPTP